MRLVLTFQTNYNGISLYPEDDNVVITPKMQKVFDEVSDTLPSKTYKWCSKWDTDLTDEQEQELINDAKEIVSPVIPDAKITFAYDTFST